MKTIILITGLLLANFALAQVPERMSYQAIIRNSDGQLIQNQNVGIKVSVLQNFATGTVVYSERLTGTTNVNGLISLAIGSGIVLSGTFGTINWSVGNYYLKTETDPTGGTNYTIVGTSQLLSVPYAMYAKSSGNTGNSQWTASGNNISNTNTGNVGIGNPNPSEKLEVSGKTKTTNLQVTNGSGTGKLLSSDANGNGIWIQAMRNDVLSIGPFSFVSNFGGHYLNTIKAFFPTNVNNGTLIAQIHLPNNGVISSNITVYFLDNSASDYSISLLRVKQGVGFPETLVSFNTNRNDTSIQTVQMPVTPPLTIDNATYTYYIGMSGNFLNGDGICGVKIPYSYSVNN